MYVIWILKWAVTKVFLIETAQKILESIFLNYIQINLIDIFATQLGDLLKSRVSNIVASNKV